MNESIMKSAIQYGLALMQQVTGVELKAETDLSVWASWTAPLFSDTRPPRSALLSAWSFIQSGGEVPTPARIPTTEITLAAELRSGSSVDNTPVKQPSLSWQLSPVLRSADPNPQGFSSAAKLLGENFRHALDNTLENFDHFYYLMQKYASTLPCTYGERGVSLFQQWRMVAAVMALAGSTSAASLPADLALIGLDMPGIQETVYTITSRGAGKSVRGRSAFVQLLVNAIVDRIVHELGLCRANVIINAGGNALILASWSGNLVTKMQDLDRKINELLLYGNDAREFSGFQGDLAFALAWEKMSWSALTYPCNTITDDGQVISEWQWYEKNLKEKLQSAKQRPFGMLLESDDGFGQLFQPEPIDSSRHCAVCRRPESKRILEFATWNEESPETPGANPVVCPVCKSFVNLANALAKKGVFLNRSSSQHPHPDWEIWQIALYSISDYYYSLDEQPTVNSLSLALSPDEFPAQGVHGFWPLSTTTPIVSQKDVEKAQELDLPTLIEGNIRDNSLLAADAVGTFKRLAVLKADVDNLGSILIHGLGERRSVALTATLSESLTLFFGGWLDKVCTEEPYHNKVYILYAGGDDLLIIGTWHVIPVLAERIAKDFYLYTGQNPNVHLYTGPQKQDHMLRYRKQAMWGEEDDKAKRVQCEVQVSSCVGSAERDANDQRDSESTRSASNASETMEETVAGARSGSL